MKVPLMNLGDGFADYKTQLMIDLDKQINECRFIGGADVEQFEKEWAQYCEADHAIGCSNGTDAITIALKSFGVGQGDTVAVPANTFIATAEAVCAAGAVPLFCDVERDTGLINCDSLVSLIESAEDVKAVIPVHLYGQMADMHRIRDIADRHGLKVIEDAAQAHGAKRGGLKPGVAGDAATFSFYPGKNLGAWGDAGAIVTGSREAAEKARLLVNHGRARGEKYLHEIAGYNNRLDAIQATVLRHKLPFLDEWNHKRTIIANRYSSMLSGLSGIEIPAVPEGSEPVWYVYTIVYDERDRIRSNLASAGISTGIYYPVPIHKQKAFKDAHCPVALHNTEYLAERILSLPLWPEMPIETVDFVADRLPA